MSLIEFPYILHKGYLMPVIPITLMNSRVWMFVDSGATFSVISTRSGVKSLLWILLQNPGSTDF